MKWFSVKSVFFTAFIILLFLLSAAGAGAQTDPLDPPANGMKKVDPGFHLLKGATLHLDSRRTFSSGQLVIRGDRIESIQEGNSSEGGDSPSRGARIWDYRGLHIYSGFIEPFYEVDTPAPNVNQSGNHWNSGITPQRNVLEGPGLNKSARDELRKMGFTAVAISPQSGVFRGVGAVVSTGEVPGDRSLLRPPVYRADVYQTLAFDGRGKPNSLAGEIALIRQTFLDVEWNARYGGGNAVSALDGLVTNHGRTRFDETPRTFFCFNTDDELETLAAAKILNEFEIERAVIIGSGREFRRLVAMPVKYPFIVPLDFPEKPSVKTIGEQEGVILSTMMAWEQAPTNLRRLESKGIQVSLTTSKIRGEGRKKFSAHLRRAIKHGLSEQSALAMLTEHPAALLGLSETMGKLAGGRLANLIVADGPIFHEKTKIRDLWVDGKRYSINEPPPPDLKGKWLLAIQGLSDGIPLEFNKKGEASVKFGEKDVKLKEVQSDGRRVSFILEDSVFGEKGIGVFAGLVQSEKNEEGNRMAKSIQGNVISSDGRSFVWTATVEIEAKALEDEGPDDSKSKGEAKDSDAENSDAENSAETFAEAVPENYGYPFGAYGVKDRPDQELVLVEGAVIWTSASIGVLQDASMLIDSGKIVWVGTREEVNRLMQTGEFGNPRVIDAQGKHVTPGLIDCHSHTGIWKGVNEVGQTVTAEVRMGDVTNPDDINWYRQLAGGLTVSNTLHGSANPIGGRNQVNKIRWGARYPEDFHLKGAKPGIKFALGENVKRRVGRYPDTRMGVQTLMRDRFLAAREYLEARRAPGGERIRRDLELDALSEILEGKRLIHCHSYRQDEILMMCRIAEEFGFKIGTFQHVLEGYKIAEAIKEFAIGASGFSDWWAYKVEVQDAIPYSGAIMHNAGVLVSFNSDDSELARRLNLEAAKAVKYGGLSKQEALKFVTINSAIQLAIQDRVGSLETGKDADFVIWSGDPLSTLSRCESTWIDGREYFSLEKDRDHREWIRKERQRLIHKILSSSSKKEDEKDKDKEKEEPDTSGGLDREGDRSSGLEFDGDIFNPYQLDLWIRGVGSNESRCLECDRLY